MVLFRWYDENTSLVALYMMTKTWNFVAKKIADGVNKFLSFFCLILVRCVCMIFSKISLVTSHGAFSTRLHFTVGNAPCRKINQSTTSIHSVPSVLVFWTAQVENTRLKCSGDVSLGNECKNKLQTHTHESLYDTYFKHGIGWHTTQYGKGYCQRYDDLQANNGHFIGDWLNIVYTGTLVTLPESFPAFRTNVRFIQVQFSVLFYFKLPPHSLSAPYATWQWHITL